VNISMPFALFPQGYAMGEAFYDRASERAILKNRIQHNAHSVIVAPRRYGKTSLIHQVLWEMKLPGKRIDLLPATNSAFVHKAIQETFSTLFYQLAPASQKAKRAIIDFIRDLHPKLTLTLLGQTLEMSSKTALPEDSLIDLLQGLNALAKSTQQKAILCFDEFQQIGELKNRHTIEASIRHAVESSSHVVYIFSGSNRHLLSQMFSDKTRPLYHLCELMRLDRIPFDIYLNILKELAKKQWQKGISEGMLTEILQLTQCHPYYVNALCRQLWQMPTPPDVAQVQKTWLNYIDTQGSWISDDLARLSPNQRNIMAALARCPTDAPYRHAFTQQVKMGASSIKKALDTLLSEDFIYSDAQQDYRVLDPAMATYLNNIHYFDFS
jgi:uncharacterized protein